MVVTFVGLGNVPSQDLVPSTRWSEHRLHQALPRGLPTLQPLHQSQCQADICGSSIALDLVTTVYTQLQRQCIPSSRELM